MSQDALGVCCWSLSRDDVITGLNEAATLNVRIAQIGFFSAHAMANADTASIKQTAAKHDIRLTGLFVGFEGEDYTSRESLRATGGLMPDSDQSRRSEHVLQAVEHAESMGVPTVVMHAGTAPEDESHPDFDTLRQRMTPLAQEAARRNIALLLETGRESSQAIHRLVSAVDHGMQVNFDPANFIAMGTDDPIKALRTLKNVIGAVHLKDAVGPQPGNFQGQPAALGQGDAQIPRLVNKLRVFNYEGPLLIECSRAMSGKENVSAGLDYVRTMLA
ncbi:MAG: sugar phosphate isomerase/epimerase family protein [Phycisphaerae bacterium]